MIDKLDIFVSENKGDEQYKDLFSAMWVCEIALVFDDYVKYYIK